MTESRTASPAGEPVAAIDCGTNSTRLLVVDGAGATLVRLTNITRLGQGVDENRSLRQDAIERTVEVLRSYRKIMDDHGVGRFRITATSAARDATNRDVFFAACEDAIGVRPELLPGVEEGRLSFAGATMGLDPDGGPFLIADIGGGSTELATGSIPGGSAGSSVEVRSLDIGCVRLTERFLLDDPPPEAQLVEAAAAVSAVLAGARAEVPAFDHARTFVGVAGTVSAVATMALGLAEYDRDRVHHARISRGAVDQVLHQLAAVPLAERRQRPGLEPQRADVIVGGTVVLETLMQVFGFEECLISESDILDGLTGTLLASQAGTAPHATR